MKLTRWTPFVFVKPEKYVVRGYPFTSFRFDEWSNKQYVWRQDAWRGWSDFAQHPVDTVHKDVGDCEDYALVAASWALSNRRGDVGLSLCFKTWDVWPSHVVAYDDERVYSSGEIYDGSLDEWVAQSKYSRAIKRPIN